MPALKAYPATPRVFDLDEPLDPHIAGIDLAAVRRMTLDLLANAVHIESAGSRPIDLTFATPEEADTIFSRIWRRLGDNCRLQPYRRSWWSLARMPLTFLGAILAATALFAL